MNYHLPYNRKLKCVARELRNNMTEAEKNIWYGYLRNFRYPVLRQKPIDNYIVDFYCPKLRLIIEIDGDTHYFEERKNYESKRTKILGKYGLKILRFTNKDILKNLSGVVDVIEKIPPAPL